jgi:anion-transporting  ArsA/GET3 family ATPase
VSEVLRDRYLRRQLLVVTGKGGVGKSAIAATLGRLLARWGRRTLVLEVDPRESLHHLFDREPSGGDILTIASGLYLQNLRPREVLDAVVEEQLKIDALSRRVLASPIYKHFAEGFPGFKELAVLGHALRLIRGLGRRNAPKIDTVILDAPATGHGVSLMAAPSLVAESIEHGPFGRMAGELAAFVNDPERCGVTVVALAEEMPVQEAIELLEVLDQRLGRVPDTVIVNGLYPDVPADAGDSDAISLWRHRRAVNEHQRARLLEHWSGPTVDLPLLPIDRGPELVRSLTQHLAGAVESLEAPGA